MPRRETYDAPMLTKTDQPLPIVKASGEEDILGGYASKFWEVDSYGEATAPGSFAKSITERGPESASSRILFRYEHQFTVGKHTEMKEDDTGLDIAAFISDDPLWGGTLRRHLSDGIQYGISIGFRRIRSRPGTADDPFKLDQAPAWLMAEFDPANVVVLEEVKLMENSAVSFPAVDSALIDSYRNSAGLITLDALITDLKAGTVRPEDRLKLEALAAVLPAALAPSSQHKTTPGTADSETEFALLDLAAVIATLPTDWSISA